MAPTRKANKPIAIIISMLVMFAVLLIIIFVLPKEKEILQYHISIHDTYNEVQKKDKNISEIRTSEAGSYIAISNSSQSLFGLSKINLSKDDISINSIYCFEGKDGELDSVHQLIARNDSNANMVEVFDTIIDKAGEVFKSEGKPFSQGGSLSENKPPINGAAWECDNCVVVISRLYGTAGPVFISVYSNLDILNSVGYANMAEGVYKQLLLIEIQMVLAM